VRGVLIGGLTDCGPSGRTRAICRRPRASWRPFFEDRNIPVVAGLRFGHVNGKISVPIGFRVRLDTKAGTIVFFHDAAGDDAEDPPRPGVRRHAVRGMAAAAGQAHRPAGDRDRAREGAASAGERARLGRTDAGVHARGQVAHFDTSSALATDRIRKARTTSCRGRADPAAAEASRRFDARRSVLSKEYRYRLLRADVMPPHLYPFVSLCRTELDLALMEEAARALVGRHDFVASGRRGKRASLP
jgi:hypothetical protein